MRGQRGGWRLNAEPASKWQIATDAQKSSISPGDWEWVDENCRLHMLTLHGLCIALAALGIERIYIVGDSTSYMMYGALVRLLGVRGVPTQFRAGTTSVQCPGKGSETFELAWSRNDLLNDNLSYNKRGKRNGPPCGQGMTFCWPWIDSYKAANTRKTLLIANTGVHHHGFSSFKLSLKSFVHSVASVAKHDDLVWFRTSVPGHARCGETAARVPFQNYSQYEKTKTDLHDWDKVEGFNQVLGTPRRSCVTCCYCTLCTGLAHNLCIRARTPVCCFARLRPDSRAAWCLLFPLPLYMKCQCRPIHTIMTDLCFDRLRRRSL